MRVTRTLKIEFYVTRNGKKPFIEWLESLKDDAGRYRLKERLDRIALGNIGDSKSLGEGISELRFNFSPGYRIYFGEEDSKVILLCGGDKSTQKKDIKRALNYWEDYLQR